MNRPLAGSPTSLGNKRFSIFPHAGPASYVQVTAPTAGTVPITGGDTVQAVTAGMKYFEHVEGGTTDDGCFSVRAIPLTVSNPSNLSAASATYGLQWIALVTAAIGGQNQTAGSEAVAGTNLSAEIVRLKAFGPN